MAVVVLVLKASSGLADWTQPTTATAVAFVIAVERPFLAA